MRKYVVKVVLGLLLVLLACGLPIPVSHAAPERATVTFAFDSQSSELLVAINSSVGVGGGDIKIDIPADIGVTADQPGGFMTGATHLTLGTTHRWFQIYATGETQGSLLVNLALPADSPRTVTLLEVNLLDGADNIVPVGTLLPLSVEVSAGPTPGQFAVLSPNGGEALQGRTTYAVTWTVLEKVSRVDLFYSWDGGIKWRQIARRRENTGTYNWRVPNQDIDRCLVKLDGYDVAGEKITDTSDAPFSVERSPHGGVIGCE